MQTARLIRKVTSAYPFDTPRATILARLPAIPAGYGQFRGKRGFVYRGYWATDDEVCRSLFWLGDFDPWVNRALTKLARPGSVALDIGANIGATALHLAKAVGPTGRVICFEPLPQNIGHLQCNMQANGFSWVQIEPIALSDKPGNIAMQFDGNHAGMASVQAAQCPHAHTVPSVTFDAWLSAQKDDLDISICKIDVEGHEPQVLAGMTDTLARQIIPAFVFERFANPSLAEDEVFRLFRQNGYRLFRVEKSPLGSFWVDLDAPARGRKTHDFVAILPEAAMQPN